MSTSRKPKLILHGTAAPALASCGAIRPTLLERPGAAQGPTHQGCGLTGCSEVQLPLTLPFGLKLGSSLMTYWFEPLSQAWSY
jgi:hypothetical protein